MPTDKPSLNAQLLAYGVHLFTASGIIFGFLSMAATVQGDKFTAFLYLGIALFIDGIDGTFARWARVKTITPGIDGTTLDNVIDYVTYAAIPALMIWQWNMVPDGWGLWIGAGIMLVTCYTYANASMKTHDNYFSGFPAIWNLVVLYLLILGTADMTNLVVLLVCGVLTFVPTAYVHPLRVKLLMPVTLVVTAIWISATLMLSYGVLAKGQDALSMPIWFVLFVGSTLYFGGISLWRSFATSKVT